MASKTEFYTEGNVIFMKKMKIAVFLLALVFCTALFAGCEKSSQEVFSINSEKVTRGEFMFYFERMKEMIAQESNLDTSVADIWDTAEIDNKKAIDVARENALDNMVSVKVQVQKAKEEGLTLTSDDRDDIRKEKKNLIQQYGGENGFNEQLKKWQVTSDIFNNILEDYKYASKLQEKYMTEDEKISTVTDEEIQAKYDTERDNSLRNSIFAKHILIMPHEESETEDGTKVETVTDEQAKAKAQEILDRVNAGEDFETLMRQYSEDSETSYDGYSFTHGDGSFIEEFDNAAYELGIGEVSGLVKTSFGYHIIKRLKSETEFPALDDVRDSVINLIKSERYQTMINEEWVPAASVVKNEEAFNSLK